MVPIVSLTAFVSSISDIVRAGLESLPGGVQVNDGTGM